VGEKQAKGGYKDGEKRLVAAHDFLLDMMLLLNRTMNQQEVNQAQVFCGHPTLKRYFSAD